jgi:hypothetical protein
MKKLIAIVILWTMSAAAGDLSGKWSGVFKVDGGDHDIPQLFILKQSGNVLTGSGGPDAQEQYPIENGRVDGGSVKFEVTTGEWRLVYDLKQTEAEALKGNLQLKSINNARTARVSLHKNK